MKKSLAYLHGVKSYWKYEEITDNPYDSEKLEYGEWEHGYITARAFDNSDIDLPDYTEQVGEFPPNY